MKTLLKRALAGDAIATAELWRAIDAGKVDDATTVIWARSVAQQVVAKILTCDAPANRRAEKRKSVLGFEGRIDRDRDRELRELALETFPEATPRQIANAADLLIDVGGVSQYRVQRKVEYIRYREKKKKAGKVK